MELRDAILGRKSIRCFQKTKLPKGLIQEILTYADKAPSAGNLKSRMFLTIENPTIIKRLSEAANQSFIADAPVVIVACTKKIYNNPYGKRAELYEIQDTSASIEHILLLVHEAGLGACWVGAFDEKKVKTILKLSDIYRPIALIPIGYIGENKGE